jgi:hypothetical protein
MMSNKIAFFIFMCLFMVGIFASAQTSIVLTQAQVDSVLAQNPPEPCEICPDPPPIEPPPVEPPPAGAAGAAAGASPPGSRVNGTSCAEAGALATNKAKAIAEEEDKKEITNL